MGKIKIRTLGDEETEAKEKQKEKEKRDQKALRQGKAVESVEPVQSEPEQPQSPQSPQPEPKKTGKKESKYKAKTNLPAGRQEKHRSKAYAQVLSKVDRTKQYSLDEALKLLPGLQRAKFDETVELHINTLEQGVAGSVTLPHGTGKQIKVAIADDALLAQIEKGKIEFDILLAHPSMMPKLAKVAKVLGPRGLMPNPKNGTVTPDPEEAAKKYGSGLMNFKTEKSPIIHLTVGKISFGDKKLEENIKMVMAQIPQNKVKNITLKSTMSPGIKITL